MLGYVVDCERIVAAALLTAGGVVRPALNDLGGCRPHGSLGRHLSRYNSAVSERFDVVVSLMLVPFRALMGHEWECVAGLGTTGDRFIDIADRGNALESA